MAGIREFLFNNIGMHEVWFLGKESLIPYIIADS